MFSVPAFAVDVVIPVIVVAQLVSYITYLLMAGRADCYQLLTVLPNGEPGLVGFIAANDDVSGGDNWSYKSCIAPVKSSPQTNLHPTFYRPAALPVAQPTVSKHWRGKNITFHGLAYPKLTLWSSNLSLTTNSYWLPWGRFAMPLINPLMPVPQVVLTDYDLQYQWHRSYKGKCYM